MSRAPGGTPSDAAGAPDVALTPLVAEVVERHDLVFDDLEIRPAGRRVVVRVTVEAAGAPGVDDGPAAGADLDAVAAISREVSAAIDEHEERAGAVLGEYTLEVTTPGTDRPLTHVRHWRRAWLRRVASTLADGTEVVGRVGAVTPPTGTDDPGSATVTLAVERGTREIALADVVRAVVEVEFKPAPEAQVETLREDRRAKEER